MNKYIHGGICFINGAIKMGILKIAHWKSFSCTVKNLISPLTEITLDKNGTLNIGSAMKMRGGKTSGEAWS